jgi:hypothetical protein
MILMKMSLLIWNPPPELGRSEDSTRRVEVVLVKPVVAGHLVSIERPCLARQGSNVDQTFILLDLPDYCGDDHDDCGAIVRGLVERVDKIIVVKLVRAINGVLHNIK